MSGWNDAFRNPELIPDKVVRMMPPEVRAKLGRRCATQEERQSRLDTRSEKELQERIASLLRQRDIVFYRARMDRATTGTVGWPDFTFCLGGRMVCLECKLPGQLPTAEQVRCIARLMRAGAVVRVVHSEAEFLAVLAELSVEYKTGPRLELPPGP